MSIRPVLAGLGLLSLLTTSVACAPGGTTPEVDTVDRGEENLGSGQRSYVVARRDYRKCMWPMCGGWWIHDVNRSTVNEVYVTELDFEQAGFDEETVGQATGGSEGGEVVLWGKLADLKDWDDPAMKVFKVKRAWRGMPGAAVAEGVRYYQVAPIEPAINCFTAPCPSLTITPLHHPGQKQQIERVSYDGFAEPLLDREWLRNRAENGDALVAGPVVDGEEFPGGPERVLAASNVFVELPETTGECPISKPACDWDAGEAATYTRDADRCVVLDRCVLGGACTLQVPSCAEGYSLVSWTGGMFACTVYACDPAWLVPAEEQPVEEPYSDDTAG